MPFYIIIPVAVIFLGIGVISGLGAKNRNGVESIDETRIYY